MTVGTLDDQNLIERGDAPVARATSPLWKIAFATLLVIGGAGAIAALLLADLRAPEAAAEDEDRRPRLRFDPAELELPAFPRPEAPAPEPPPAAPAVADEPERLFLPELPPPEPRDGYAPPPYPAVPPAPVTPAEPPPPSPAELARQRRLAAPLTGTGSSAGTVNGAGENDAARRGGLDLSTTRTATAVARRLSDMTFLVPKGTYLPCILDTAIQSDQAGMVACTLPRDVYGADGTVVLLDRGSQILGEYRTATLTAGKRRLFVVWDRVRTPEGVVVDIASPGTGPLGRAGMGGHIDNHYWQRVGIPVLMSAVSFGAESWAREQLTSDQARWIEQTTDDSLSTVLGELARIRPTLHKNQGDPINILVARDLDLSPVYRLTRR
jgi:type IV secretion system protein VirB10